MTTENTPTNPSQRPAIDRASASLDQIPSKPLKPSPFGLSDIRDALRTGWDVFRATLGPSITLGALFTMIWIVLLLTLTILRISPLGLVPAGGFLLIGPALLAGFFALARRHETGEKPSLHDALKGFSQAGMGFWALSGLCAFLFLIWVTDAGILYAVLIGSGPLFEPLSEPGLWLQITDEVQRFALWSSLLWAAIAFGLYLVSVFSVPLVYERRAGVISAIQSSVGTVFGNLGPALVWGLVIAVGTLLGILLPPLLPVTFPVLAYGSFALYRKVFPRGSDGQPEHGHRSDPGAN